jgi:hypothetical protein
MLPQLDPDVSLHSILVSLPISYYFSGSALLLFQQTPYPPRSPTFYSEVCILLYSSHHLLVSSSCLPSPPSNLNLLCVSICCAVSKIARLLCSAIPFLPLLAPQWFLDRSSSPESYCFVFDQGILLKSETSTRKTHKVFPALICLTPITRLDFFSPELSAPTYSPGKYMGTRAHTHKGK